METNIEKIIGKELIEKNSNIDTTLLDQFKKQFVDTKNSRKTEKNDYSLEHPFESKIFSSYCRI